MAQFTEGRLRERKFSMIMVNGPRFWSERGTVSGTLKMAPFMRVTGKIICHVERACLSTKMAIATMDSSKMDRGMARESGRNQDLVGVCLLANLLMTNL